MKSPVEFPRPVTTSSAQFPADTQYLNNISQNTNFTHPPTHYTSQYSNYSYHRSLPRNSKHTPNFKGVDQSKLAMEAVMRTRGRSLNRPINHDPDKHYAPLMTQNRSNSTSEGPSTSLTNITQTEPNSSADSGSIAYNFSPPTSIHQQYARIINNNTATLNDRQPSVPTNNPSNILHHSQEYRTNNIELNPLKQNHQEGEGTQTLDRTGRKMVNKETLFTTVPEISENGSIQETMKLPLNRPAPMLDIIPSAHTSVLDRNKIQLTNPTPAQIPKNRSKSVASWLELPEDNSSRSQNPRSTSASVEISKAKGTEHYNPLNIRYEKQDMSPISQASTKTLTLSNGTIKSNNNYNATNNGTVTASDLKQNNQELKKIIIQKSQLSGYGFSITDKAKLDGIFVKSVEPNGAAQRGGMKPHDRILSVSYSYYSTLDTCACIE